MQTGIIIIIIIIIIMQTGIIIIMQAGITIKCKSWSLPNWCSSKLTTELLLQQQCQQLET